MSSEAEEHNKPCSDEIATRFLHVVFLALSRRSLVALPGLFGANILDNRYFRPASLGERLLSGEHDSHTEKSKSCGMRMVHLMFERHCFWRSCSAQFRSCSPTRQGQFSVPSSFFKKSRNDCSTWLPQASPTVLVVQSRFELAPAADLKLDCAMKRKNAALQDSGFEQVVKCRAVTSPRRTLFDKSHTLCHGKTDWLHVCETNTKKIGALRTNRKQDHVRV